MKDLIALVNTHGACNVLAALAVVAEEKEAPLWNLYTRYSRDPELTLLVDAVRAHSTSLSCWEAIAQVSSAVWAARIALVDRKE